jgi:hypothetical protein
MQARAHDFGYTVLIYTLVKFESKTENPRRSEIKSKITAQIKLWLCCKFLHFYLFSIGLNIPLNFKNYLSRCCGVLECTKCFRELENNCIMMRSEMQLQGARGC